MNIGYPCQCLGVTGTSFRTCTKKFVTKELLIDIISHNLTALDHVLDYNHAMGISLFRISSDLIPFGSSEVNFLPWQTMFQEELKLLGKKARAYGMRLSMHPGQYTLLNALDPLIVKRSIDDLVYHCAILDGMELDQSSKLVLHIGGVYQAKQEAIERFLKVFDTLPHQVKQRLVIENDDRYYTLEDVLTISSKIHIPVIFDNLHHHLHPSFPDWSDHTCMEAVKQTWTKADGAMKIHYSQQDESRRPGAHAPYLNGAQFLAYTKQLPPQVDVMIEIKDKNLSALQALYVLRQRPFEIKHVWEKYRYLVLRHSSMIYEFICESLSELEVDFFFSLINQALKLPRTKEQTLWCYETMYREWNTALPEKQSQNCERAIRRYRDGLLSETGLCACFQRAAVFLHRNLDYLFLYV